MAGKEQSQPKVNMDHTVAVEIFQQVETVLDSQVSDLQIEETAVKMVRWEHFAPFFELSEAEQEEIRKDNPRNYRLQKRAALYAWRDKNGRRATYRALMCVIERVGKETETPDVLKNFHSYLTECYTQAPHPSHSNWPFSSAEAYVHLPLSEASIEEDDLSLQQNAQPRKPVKLSDILCIGDPKAKRKVVLMEGVAGSGKTTLAWFVYQKWAEGILFESFSLLILVSLDDPVVQSATCLADIIPHSSSERREAVAKAIADRHGKGVCFILDGWDELPPHVQKRGSFLFRLIAGKLGQTMLPHCSVIVTSRPGASGALRPLLTARIVIERLDTRRIDDLLSQCLSLEESEELSEMLKQRPQLANLCNLPINTMIVIHLFRNGVHIFPETRTGLFKALLCNLLLRHIQLRTEHEESEVGEEFEFRELPADVLGKFTAISSLAFEGIMEKAKVFKKASLKSLGLSFPYDTLSLMETHLNIYGFICSFAFLHYSVQEFLAAWHMTRLGSEEQAKAVFEILHSSPLSPVLPFFAGLTGLSNTAVRDVLLEVTRYPLAYPGIVANQPQTESDDRRRLALALLNCIYESQDPALCQRVNCPTPFGLISMADLAMSGSIGELEYEASLSFVFLGLDPIECRSIGYFMANRSSCTLDLGYCFIGDAGIDALMRQLVNSPAISTSSAERTLELIKNPFTTRSMKMVSKVLQTSLLSKVSIMYCWVQTQVATNLKYLIEGLSRRSTSISLDLPNTITSKHVHYLVLLLATCRIKYFALVDTNLTDSIPFLAEALKQNTGMEAVIGLRLDNCIEDRALVDLGLKTRTSVTHLGVTTTHLTTPTMIQFLQSQYFSRLKMLDISRELHREENSVYYKLQKYRFQSDLPPLKVTNHTPNVLKSGFEFEHAINSMPKNVRERKD